LPLADVPEDDKSFAYATEGEGRGGINVPNFHGQLYSGQLTSTVTKY